MTGHALTGRRGKNVLLLVSIVLAGAVLAAWTQTWYTIPVGLPHPVTVDGSVAAPALTALALSELVLVLALAIAGPFFRVVLGVIQALVGVAIIASAASTSRCISAEMVLSVLNRKCGCNW